MGEAKRRKVALENGPCFCGSSKPGNQCCFNGREWHKHAAALGLRALPPAGAIEKCYMKELGSCSGGISREHLISEAIIRLLAGDGDFTVAGLPWIPPGEFKAIGPKSLVATCLCRKHNSAIHALDDAALAFFTMLKSCLDRSTDTLRFIVSGHDIERWLLKTLKAMAASGNLAHGQEKLPGVFSSDVRVLDMLDTPSLWPGSTGLYCIMRAGELTENHNRFQLAPLSNQRGEVGGLWTNILGLSFILMLEPLDIAQNPQLAGAVFRPGQIVVTHPGSTSWLVLSWDDDKTHLDSMSLKFVRQVRP
jgi:hypothetical protein